MTRYLMVPAIAIAMVAIMWSGAYAGDEFEDGFKYELGAIAARATLGFGVGLVRGVAYGEPHRDKHVSRRYRNRRHWRDNRYCRHCRHGRGPHFAKRTVVYRPYPVPVRRVQRRVVYYTPGYRY